MGCSNSLDQDANFNIDLLAGDNLPLAIANYSLVVEFLRGLGHQVEATEHQQREGV
jgi:hypothetical protein